MSAPIEVWIEGCWLHHDDQDYRYPVEGFYGPVKPEKDEKFVRYLRADLTCGECALRSTKKCAQHGRSGDLFLHNWAISPACMAFKERKP